MAPISVGALKVIVLVRDIRGRRVWGQYFIGRDLDGL